METRMIPMPGAAPVRIRPAAGVLRRCAGPVTSVANPARENFRRVVCPGSAPVASVRPTTVRDLVGPSVPGALPVFTGPADASANVPLPSSMRGT